MKKNRLTLLHYCDRVARTGLGSMFNWLRKTRALSAKVEETLLSQKERSMGSSAYGRGALVVALAAAILVACGGGGTGGSFEAPPLAQITGMTQPLATPPAVEGTYRGSYTEKRNGKTYSGKFHMVVHEQANSKISGPFDVRGGFVGRYNTGFHGKVRPSGSGAELRFDCPQLGGYDVGVEFRASVVGDNLTGTGHGGHSSQGDYQRWTLKATKH